MTWQSMAEQTVAGDGGSITACRGMMPLRPAPLLDFLVKRCSR
jgi:hypothetical protein